MFMNFALHWQRTSIVPFYQRTERNYNEGEVLGIKQLSAVLGDMLSQALIGFHAFIDCDP